MVEDAINPLQPNQNPHGLVVVCTIIVVNIAHYLEILHLTLVNFVPRKCCCQSATHIIYKIIFNYLIRYEIRRSSAKLWKGGMGGNFKIPCRRG